MPRSRAGFATVAALTAAGAVWVGFLTLLPEQAVPVLRWETPYVLEIQSGQTGADLEISPTTRYLLVVSSLGSAANEHRVVLESRPVPCAAWRPVRVLEPFCPGRLPAEYLPDATSNARSTGVASAPTQQTAASASNSSRREFFVHVTDGALDDPAQYVRVKAREIAVGRRARVFLDEQQRAEDLFPGLADEIVYLLDHGVLPRLEAVLGRTRDVDGDGKFTVLLTPWLGRLQGGRISLGGFARGTDFRSDLPAPFSNRCDLVYVNTNVRPGTHLRTLLAHELAHAICFSEREAGPLHQLRPREEDWLNEALAHLAENVDGPTWSNLDYRVSRFLTAPAEYPLVVTDYYRRGMWRDHGCRGSTYLFLRWCVDQFGEGLLRRLITGAASGTANLEQATGRTFEDLYRHWSLAVWTSGRWSRAKTTVEPVGSDAVLQAVAAPAAQSGGYTSVDLYAPRGGWSLAGPRTVAWDLAAGQCLLRLRGTSTSYVEVGTSGRAEVRRLRLHADPNARLQVSLIALGDHWLDARLAAHWSEDAADSFSASDGRGLQVWITAAADGNWRVESVACERNYDEVRESYCFTAGELRQFACASGCNSSWGLSAVEPGLAGFCLPVVSRPDAGGPLLVKAVLRDARGFRTAVWTEIEERRAPRRRVLEVADWVGEPHRG